MKAEFFDHINTTTAAATAAAGATNINLFSKFHHQNFHHPTPQYLIPNHPNFHLQLTTTADTSEDADSHAPPPQSSSPKKQKSEDSSVRRPRGRPLGSKNKLKPPVIITRGPEHPTMSPYILEIADGADIVTSLKRFTLRRDVGLCILAASGAVVDVTLRQPPTAAPSATVTFHGRFDLLSLSAVILRSGGNAGAVSISGSGNREFNDGLFTIALAGPQGQMVSGRVVGPVRAAGTVFVVASSFNDPTYHRLPEDNEDVGYSVSGGGERHDNVSPGVSGGGGGDRESGQAAGGGVGGGPGTVGMYGSSSSMNNNSDVLWVCS